MSDAEYKLLIAVVGVASAILGVVSSILTFLWMEGRRRYAQRLSGLRLIWLFCDLICANLRVNRLDIAELKPDWVLRNLEGVLGSQDALVLMSDLMQLRAKILVFPPNGDSHSLMTEANRIRDQAAILLKRHGHRWAKLAWLTG